MYKKVTCFLFLLVAVSTCHPQTEWDLAVAVKDQIVVMTTNGTYLGTALAEFNELKALTYDNLRHQFFVSDMNQMNDSIYAVKLSKETDISPLIENLADDIQGLAIDPITDTLYWTDSLSNTINYMSLKKPNEKPKIFWKFNETSPKDVAIDSCRRFLYTTTAKLFETSTIERFHLETKQHQTIIQDEIGAPTGITVDVKSKRLYWLSVHPNIYFRIETTDLNGNDHRVLYEGTHQSPWSIALKNDAIYWTDTNNNILWKKPKESQEPPKKFHVFTEKPRGLFVKDMHFLDLPSCKEYLKEYEETSRAELEYYESITENPEIKSCLNGGVLENNWCNCPRGFTGKNCETSLCYNYCVHGDCYHSSSGYPECRCFPGFSGARCEKNTCDSFCLNDGTCHRDSSKKFGATCTCLNGFEGSRCEMDCNLFCMTRRPDLVLNERNAFLCKCEIISNSSSENESNYDLKSNKEFHYNKNLQSGNNLHSSLNAQAITSYESDSLISRFRDPITLTLLSCTLILIAVLGVTCSMVCKLRRRPRIKKRIIVNKNVTPLTYRPQQTPTEQCEITIENCCNMNVCETPCFEPTQISKSFQNAMSKKDEKKTLLSNMENGGDDLY